MAVSDRDREYFRRLGAIKAASHESATQAHLALDLGERLRRSWDLYRSYRTAAPAEPRADDPSPFYARARALGLYRP